MVGAAIPRPITLIMNGTLARAISWLAMVWKPLWPWPPYSVGQSEPTSPAAWHFFCQAHRYFRCSSLATSIGLIGMRKLGAGGRFSASQRRQYSQELGLFFAVATFGHPICLAGTGWSNQGWGGADLRSHRPRGRHESAG